MAMAGVAGVAVMLTATGGRDAAAVVLGMAGPLTAAAGSWAALERLQSRSPDRVPRAMLKLFAAKMILFGAYCAAAVLLLRGAAGVFAASFAVHYVLLHVMEALYLRRLFAAGAE